MTAYEHSWQVRQAHGFRVFDDAEVSEEFRQFLDGRAWTHTEGPGALFTHSVGWLRRARVLLPGITVLIRRMHATLAAATAQTDPALPGRLLASLRVPAGGCGSPRWSPGAVHPPGCRVRAW